MFLSFFSSSFFVFNNSCLESVFSFRYSILEGGFFFCVWTCGMYTIFSNVRWVHFTSPQRFLNPTCAFCYVTVYYFSLFILLNAQMNYKKCNTITTDQPKYQVLHCSKLESWRCTMLSDGHFLSVKMLILFCFVYCPLCAPLWYF